MTTFHRPSSKLAPTPRPDARISFRQPVTEVGFVDAGWWPRSRDLRAELPALFDVLWTACRDVDRVSYNLPFWEPVPRRMQLEERVVRLRGLRGQDPLLLTLFDSSDNEHIDVLVIPPETDAAFAERILQLAGGVGSVDPPGRIFELAATLAGKPA